MSGRRKSDENGRLPDVGVAHDIEEFGTVAVISVVNVG